MTTTGRRTFLQQTAAGAAALTLSAGASAAQSKRLVIGMIGPGGLALPKTKIGTGHRKSPKERAEERRKKNKKKKR